ncbi:3727_t:CDS:2, partial [Ambispora gerdemannii]
MEKVLLFAEEFEVSDKFVASADWINNFKRRNNLKFYKKCGESGSVNMNKIPKFREQLQDIIKDYKSQDVFNSYSPVKGKKKSKDRVSLLVTTNVIGDEKLLILFIHKYETPRALRGINKSTLPLNSQMRIANQKILLLMDNAKCHEADNINELSNIWVHFLPPNTTSIIQPLDQGILYKSESQQLEHELDQLIQWLPITEPLSAHEFICIDDNIDHEEIDIKEIVDVVLGKGLENEPDDKDESEEEISIGEALNSTKILITFIKQSEW